jgi:predicted enzyme related to lactoylglutathione lyase
MSKVSLNTASIIVGLTIVAIVTSGCNPLAKVRQEAEQKMGENFAENIIEKATGEKVNIDQSGKTVTVTTKDGTYKAGQQSLDDVKKYIALPDWLTADEKSGVMISDSSKDNKIGVYGSVHSEKSLEETKTFWVKYFADEKYEDISKTEANGTLIISGAKKAPETSLAVTVSEPTKEEKADGNTKVQVAIMYSAAK